MTLAPILVEHVHALAHDIAHMSVGDGRAVVLVHGNFASKRWWRELLQHAPAGYRVIALDLPNFGDSAPLAEPITIAAYARVLAGFVGALGLEAPVLVGHSLGGAVVMRAVADDPERYAGLVLVSSSAPEGLTTPEAHYPLLEMFKGNRELLAQALAPMLASRLPDDFEALVDDALRMHPDAFSGNARALHDLGLAPALARFERPVWVLRGGLDPLITAEMAAATAAAFVGAPVQHDLWSDVGHSPASEAPERFAAGLARFLTNLEPAGGAP
jgi:pimeloyl-ACP methyl ester carboxylesterase